MPWTLRPVTRWVRVNVSLAVWLSLNDSVAPIIASPEIVGELFDRGAVVGELFDWGTIVGELFGLGVVVGELVLDGAALMVSVNGCTALGAMPLLAVRLNVYVPPAPPAGMPEIVAVPSRLSLNATPAGSDPGGIESVAAG